MRKILFVAFVVYLSKNAATFSVARDPWTLATTSCLDVPNAYYNNPLLNSGAPCGCSTSCNSGCSGNCGSSCNCGTTCNSGCGRNCGCGGNSGCGGNCGSSCNNCGANYGCFNGCNSGSCDCGCSGGQRRCRSCNVCEVCAPVPCGCYRSLDDVCAVCERPSPVCDCLSKCDCGCNRKCPIYFPEVQYPMTILDISPFYYGSCFTY